MQKLDRACFFWFAAVLLVAGGLALLAAGVGQLLSSSSGQALVSERADPLGVREPAPVMEKGKAEYAHPIPARGPYLGQTPPGAKAERFAPGLVSTPRDEHGVPAFTPDGSEFYLTRVVGPPWDFENLRFRMGRNGAWSQETVRFDHRERHAEIFVSRDGKRLYCCSLRPISGDPDEQTWNLWVKDLDGKDRPSRPLPPPVNSSFHECQPFEAADGSLFFTSWRDGSPDLFRAVERSGGWVLDEGFGPAVNSPQEDKGAFVSEDGDRLLFWSNRPGGEGKDDIYLCRVHADGRWGAPVNAGPLVNSPFREWYPRLSPDGRYLFFLSDRTGDFDVYWIDASVLGAEKTPSASCAGIVRTEAAQKRSGR
ncbi:MAG TPA: hypothetical protein P5143_05295 [Candidatus Aminicenantes bacterium]|nr:hypothetical protein [Candidatus Aminicenantes bacterium]